MSDVVIRVENLSKQYRLGAISGRTLREDLTRLGAKWRGQPDPTLKIDQPGPNRHSNEQHWALQDVSFEVKQGEVLGIIGRNGAGKSTLLKILSRVTAPTSGAAKVKGRIASLLEVGTGFHPELTGRENVYLNGSILGMRKHEIERRFDEIVDFSGVERFINTPVKRYSSGMYVRLAFAVAAHLEPEILLVDEVLAVGDAAFQAKSANKMTQVSKQGRTILLVSHNMAAIRRLCSRSVLLQNGFVQLVDKTEDVVDRYLEIAESQGTPIVNLPPAPANAPGQATRLSFFSCEDEPKAQFRINEEWKIKLEFEIFRYTKHVIAAIGLINTEGVAITTFWSEAKDLSAGCYWVEYICNIPLKSCNLQFAVGLSTYERPIQYIPEVGRVVISDIAEGIQPIRSAGTGLLVNIESSPILSFQK